CPAGPYRQQALLIHLATRRVLDREEAAFVVVVGVGATRHARQRIETRYRGAAGSDACQQQRQGELCDFHGCLLTGSWIESDRLAILVPRADPFSTLT